MKDIETLLDLPYTPFCGCYAQLGRPYMFCILRANAIGFYGYVFDAFTWSGS